MIVVSLSTIPPRFNMLGGVLQSLLNQRQKIDEIRVNIPRTYRRFPEHAFTEPDLPEGVTLRICDEDFGPATKVLPALQDYRGREDVRIFYCDDDRVAHPTWVEEFVRISKSRPRDCIVNSGLDLKQLGFDTIKGRSPWNLYVPGRRRFDMVYRGRRIKQQVKQLWTGKKLPKPPRGPAYAKNGYIDIAEGCGGVLVKPHFFDDKVFDVPAKLWSVDDIWLSGMLELKGTGVWINRQGQIPPEMKAATDSALYMAVIEGYDRTEANAACVRYLQETYGIWPNREKPAA
ncbi:glycosyltransferase family A protein [Chachezhania sediminis]|uniref:glycosyltransferase family A protein n=1 Tax=Chachezhania sediminis TaxID=2599291 RepID=UPI00131D75FE|nr:glycosyltransferase family A protein [Chachezhania sediminis]